ncbi:MAG: hypothetical protein WA667_13110 [Candidatus Nitrosopolaris sp.]
MIPQRFAIKTIDRGWILRNIAAKDRFIVDYEDIFFFVKSEKYYFETQYERYDKPQNRWGGNTYKASDNRKMGCAYNHKQNQPLNRPNPFGRIKGCVWRISTKSYKGRHYAVFPVN